MTQQEIEATFARHEARLNAIDERLDRIAEGQEVNMQQIAQNTEGITALRILMEDYFRRLGNL